MSIGTWRTTLMEHMEHTPRHLTTLYNTCMTAIQVLSDVLFISAATLLRTVFSRVGPGISTTRTKRIIEDTAGL